MPGTRNLARLAVLAAVQLAACGDRYVLGAIDTGDVASAEGTGTGTGSSASGETGTGSTSGGTQDLPQLVCDMPLEIDEPAVPMDPSPAGMTWYVGQREPMCGVSLLRCGTCEPYVGDTACGTELSILCLRPDMDTDPGVPPGDTQGWSGGTIGATSARAGDSFADRAAVDAFCASELGAGFRVAGFHDGRFSGANGFFGGWGFWAYGEVAEGQRYWTYIEDKPNCWAH